MRGTPRHGQGKQEIAYMSMREYGIEGYGFNEKPLTDESLPRIREFIGTKASQRVKDALKGKAFGTIEELDGVCLDVFDSEGASTILAETLSDVTGQTVRCQWDENESEHKILLVPCYPWEVQKPMSREEYDKIVEEYGKAFYGPYSFPQTYDTCIWCG